MGLGGVAEFCDSDNLDKIWRYVFPLGPNRHARQI